MERLFPPGPLPHSWVFSPLWLFSFSSLSGEHLCSCFSGSKLLTQKLRSEEQLDPFAEGQASSSRRQRRSMCRLLSGLYL